MYICRCVLNNILALAIYGLLDLYHWQSITCYALPIFYIIIIHNFHIFCLVYSNKGLCQIPIPMNSPEKQIY